MNPFTNILQNNKKNNTPFDLNSTPSSKSSKTKFRNDFLLLEKLNKTNDTNNPNNISKNNKLPICFTLLTNKKNNINDLKFKFREESLQKEKKNHRSFFEQQPSIIKKKKINLSAFRNRNNQILIMNDIQNKNLSDGGRSSSVIPNNNNQSKPVSFIFNLLNKNFSSFFNNLSPKVINSNNNSNNNNSYIFNNNSIINNSNIHININNNLSPKNIFPKINNIKKLENISMRKFLMNNKDIRISRNDKRIFPFDSYFINDSKKKDIKKSESFYDNSDSNNSKKSKNFKFSKWNTIDKNNSNFDSNLSSTLCDKNLEQSEIVMGKDSIKNSNKYKNKKKKNFKNEPKIKFNNSLKKKLKSTELLSKIEKIVKENSKYMVIQKSDWINNNKKSKSSSSDDSYNESLKSSNSKNSKKIPDVANLFSNLSPITKEIKTNKNTKTSAFKNKNKKLEKTNNDIKNNQQKQKKNLLKKRSSEKIEFVLDLSGNMATERSKESDTNIIKNSLFLNKDEKNSKYNELNLKPVNNLENVQMSNELIRKSKKFFMKRKSVYGMSIKRNSIRRDYFRSKTLIYKLKKRRSSTLKNLLSNYAKKTKKKNFKVFRVNYSMFNSKKKDDEIYSQNNFINKLKDNIFIEQKEEDTVAKNLGIDNQDITKERKMDQIILSNKKRILNMETKSLILDLRKKLKESNKNNKKNLFNVNNDIKKYYIKYPNEIINNSRIEAKEILSNNIEENINDKYLYGNQYKFHANNCLDKYSAKYLNKNSNFEGFSSVDSNDEQDLNKEQKTNPNDYVNFRISKSNIFNNKYNYLDKNWKNIIIYILDIYQLLFRTVLNFGYSNRNGRNTALNMSCISRKNTIISYISPKSKTINFHNFALSEKKQVRSLFRQNSENKNFPTPTRNNNNRDLSVYPFNKLKNYKHICILKNKNFFLSTSNKNSNDNLDDSYDIENCQLNYSRNQDIYKDLLNIISERENKLFIKQFQKIENDIEIDHQFQDGNTLLILCTRDGNDTLVKFLLENGADPNIQNDQGNTALHFAIGNKFFNIADFLTKNGAQEDILNLHGNTPWDCFDKVVE